MLNDASGSNVFTLLADKQTFAGVLKDLQL